MITDLINKHGIKAAAPPSAFDTTWDPAHAINGLTLSPDFLTISENTGNGLRVLTTKSRNSGKSYWELTLTLASQGDVWVGLAPAGIGYINPLSGPAGAYWRSEAQFVRNGSWVVGGSQWRFEYANNLTLRFAYDASNRYFWAAIENTWLYGTDPSSGINPFCQLAGTYDVMPIFVTDYRSGLNKIVGNFGNKPFKYPVPDGFDSGF